MFVLSSIVSSPASARSQYRPSLKIRFSSPRATARFGWLVEMVSSNHSETISHVDRYVRGDLSRSAFRAWLVNEVWNAESLEDSLQEDILYELESLDAEYTNGTWSEDELKTELRNRILIDRFDVASAS